MPDFSRDQLILIRGSLTKTYNELEKTYEHGSDELSRAMIQDRHDIAVLLKVIKAEIASRSNGANLSKEKNN